MAEYVINVHRVQNQLVNDGWSASVAQMVTGAINSVGIGESEIHRSKQAAYATIKKRVEKLDYTNDTIRFIGVVVASLADVQAGVAALG